jgi:hypothetical protein
MPGTVLSAIQQALQDLEGAVPSVRANVVTAATTGTQADFLAAVDALAALKTRQTNLLNLLRVVRYGADG